MLLPAELLLRELATAASEQIGMSGPERVLLYRVAIETGLRASECRDLNRGSLVLDATRPRLVSCPLRRREFVPR
jgi:hypothetical protein